MPDVPVRVGGLEWEAIMNRLDALEAIWDIAGERVEKIRAMEEELANARDWDLDDKVGQRYWIGQHERWLGQAVYQAMCDAESVSRPENER